MLSVGSSVEEYKRGKGLIWYMRVNMGCGSTKG